MIKVIYAINEIFGHFLEFGTSGGFDIAYNDITNCFLTFGYAVLTIRSLFLSVVPNRDFSEKVVIIGPYLVPILPKSLLF